MSAVDPGRSPVRYLPLLARSLVLAALIAQAVAVTGSAGSGPRATQTRVTSCAGMNFHPIDDDTQFGFTNGTMLFRSGSSGSGFFLCDPGLPHRAVVTKVQFTIYDSATTGRVLFCSLYRHGLEPGTASQAQVLASVADTTYEAHPGTIRRIDTTIVRATIDNARYAYWLQCRLEGDGVGIFGANVTYAISSANG